MSRPIGLAPGAGLTAAGQDVRKYSSRNPIVRWLITRWLRRLRGLVRNAGGVVADIGTGEGIALERLALRPTRIVGIDYREDKLQDARRRLSTLFPIRADAGMLPLRDSAIDLCLCVEVLEHLVTPAPAVAEIARATRGRCVISVPWEPFFRLGNLVRGRNLRRWGNDPEHVQRFSRRRLRAMLEEHFADVTVSTCFPWLLAVARPV